MPRASCWLDISLIRISARRRRGVSARTAERYRMLLEEGRTPPPIRVRRDGPGFVVVDGRHRLVAHQLAGIPVIEAQIT